MMREKQLHNSIESMTETHYSFYDKPDQNDRYVQYLDKLLSSEITKTIENLSELVANTKQSMNVLTLSNDDLFDPAFRSITTKPSKSRISNSIEVNKRMSFTAQSTKTSFAMKAYQSHYNNYKNSK
jgi:hypothetical protein